MILTFTVEIDIPTEEIREAEKHVPYLKHLLSGWLNKIGTVKDVRYEHWLSKGSQEYFDRIEYQAWTHGEMDL